MSFSKKVIEETLIFTYEIVISKKVIEETLILTLISLITVEVGINVEGVQKLQNK